MHKDEFREMRKRDFFALPQTSTDGDFWRHEQELIMKEIYAKLSKYPVCPQGVLNLATLESKQYFVEAVWVSRKMGLEQLMKTQDRKSTRLNSSHSGESRMPSSA